MAIYSYQSFKEKELLFEHKVINDKSTLYKIVLEYANSGRWIFRGVNEASYFLYTTAQRAFDRLGLNCSYHDFIAFYIERTKQSQEINEYFNKKNFQITDFLIMSLLQHYNYPTPLLDFSYDIRSALFFATNNVVAGKGDSGISDYFSLYIANLDDDSFPNVLQMNNLAADQAQIYLENREGGVEDLVPESRKGFLSLPFRDYKNLPILLVPGDKDSAIGVRIPAASLNIDYYISNPNLRSQHGLFVFSAQDDPIECVVHKRGGYRKKHIKCFDIHKNLKDIIIKCLNDDKINSDTMYPKTQKSKNITEWLDKCGMPSMDCIQNNTDSAREYFK